MNSSVVLLVALAAFQVLSAMSNQSPASMIVGWQNLQLGAMLALPTQMPASSSSGKTAMGLTWGTHNNIILNEDLKQCVTIANDGSSTTVRITAKRADSSREVEVTHNPLFKDLIQLLGYEACKIVATGFLSPLNLLELSISDVDLPSSIEGKQTMPVHKQALFSLRKQ